MGWHFCFVPLADSCTAANHALGCTASCLSSVSVAERLIVDDRVEGQDVTFGMGVQATPGSVVSVLYIGKLENGAVFDSSDVHGKGPLIITLGQPGIITGFQIGINGMKEGGERSLV